MTATIFDYWLADHPFAYNWVLNKLRVEGADGVIDGDTVTFTAISDNPTPLADFLDGRTYHYLNWVEVGATLDDPAPEEVIAPKKGKGKKKADPVVTPEPTPVPVVTPEPVAPVEPVQPTEPVVEPTEPVVTPVEPTPEPVVTPAPVVTPDPTPAPVAPATPAVKGIMDFDADKDGKLSPAEIKAYTDYVSKKK